MLERIAAFCEAIESQNPTAPIRIGLTDSEAVDLVNDLVSASRADDLVHAAAAIPASAALAGVLAQTPPSDLDQLQDWAERKGAASRALWDSIQGSVIDGVEIVRKRVS